MWYVDDCLLVKESMPVVWWVVLVIDLYSLLNSQHLVHRAGSSSWLRMEATQQLDRQHLVRRKREFELVIELIWRSCSPKSQRNWLTSMVIETPLWHWELAWIEKQARHTRFYGVTNLVHSTTTIVRQTSFCWNERLKFTSKWFSEFLECFPYEK